jgi:hypothetical protein
MSWWFWCWPCLRFSDVTSLDPEAQVSRMRQFQWGWCWLAIGVLLCVVVARVAVSGQDALARGDAAMAQGQTDMAVTAWRTSMGWYLPFSAPWRAEAAERLSALAEEQEARGDLGSAVASLTALRAGRYASRTMGGVDDWGEDHRLALLLARWEAEAATMEGRPLQGELEARVAFFQARLGADKLPNIGYGLGVVVGFVLWIAGFLVAIRRSEAIAWRWAALGSVVGFTVFVIGLFGA